MQCGLDGAKEEFASRAHLLGVTFMILLPVCRSESTFGRFRKLAGHWFAFGAVAQAQWWRFWLTSPWSVELVRPD
jgi:hypothetical protein